MKKNRNRLPSDIGEEDAVMKDQELKWCIYWKQIKRHRF